MAVELPVSLREFPPHLLTLEFLTPDQIKGIVDYAVCIKPVRQLSALAVGVNESFSPFYLEAIRETGATVSRIEIDDESENLMQPESLAEYDVILLDGLNHAFVEKLARFSSAALVNCGSNWAEPMSALAGWLNVKRNKLPADKFYLPEPASPRRQSLLKLCASMDISVELHEPTAEESIIIETLRQRNAKIDILPEGEDAAARKFPDSASCRENRRKILQAILFVYG
jgi:hypothetical protein